MRSQSQLRVCRLGVGAQCEDRPVVLLHLPSLHLPRRELRDICVVGSLEQLVVVGDRLSTISCAIELEREGTQVAATIRVGRFARAHQHDV